MDTNRFDAWTRRAFGLAIGGGVASLVALSALHDADAKKKRKKKRCRKLHQTCTLESKKKRCCKPLSCQDETFDPDVGACCRAHQVPCGSEDHCCLSFECRQAVGLAGKRCCSPLGISCGEDGDCCAGDGVICHDLYDCCRDVQAACAASDECCGELVCDQIAGLGTDTRCCSAGDGFCTEDEHCCEGFACNTADQQCVPV